jgi:hypothetical protein
MLLLSPPLYKPSEPPPALAYLAGTLQAHGLECRVCDLNIEAFHWLLGKPCGTDDTWSRRAEKNLAQNMTRLRDISTYSNIARYRRAVADVNRLIEVAGKKRGIELSLTNYQNPRRSPLNSGDLRQAAAEFAENIFFPFWAPRLDELLRSKDTQVVGLSINFLSQALCGFAILGYLRKTYPDVKLVLGGGLVTTWCSNPKFQNPFNGLIDHLVAGPGEEFLLRLHGTRPARKMFVPDYHQLPKHNYLAPGFVLPYCGSFGCFWQKCSFCPERSEKNPFRMVPPLTTCGDLQQLTLDHKPALIHLVDNSIPPATLKALAAHPPGAPWYGFVRFAEPLLDRGFCTSLRESGCVMLKLGLESGDQQVLDSLHKGIELPQVRQVLANLYAAGIASYVYLLFGTPAEDHAAAEKTLQFIVTHQELISFCNLAIFNLPIHSPESHLLLTSEFSAADLSIYSDFHHPLGWHRGEVRRWLDSRLKRDPGIKAILANDPTYFTSNHAPFFALAGAMPGKG